MLTLMTEQSLARLVRSLRTDLGLSQDDLSERANVSRGWVSRVEKGDIKRPDPAILERLAAALNQPAANLLSAAGYRVEPQPVPQASTIDLLRQALARAERERQALDLLDPELQVMLQEFGGDLTPE